MSEFVSRVEFEDICRHLTTKADRAQLQAACVMEEAKCLSRALDIASYQIRQLTTWLVPLLSVEQQEVIGVDQRRGVVDERLVSEDVVEANDGAEWRARLKRRVAELRGRSTLSVDSQRPEVRANRAWLKRLDALIRDLDQTADDGLSFESGPLPQSAVVAMKEVGAHFAVDPDLDGPCYNRDAVE